MIKNSFYLHYIKSNDWLGHSGPSPKQTVSIFWLPVKFSVSILFNISASANIIAKSIQIKVK